MKAADYIMNILLLIKMVRTSIQSFFICLMKQCEQKAGERIIAVLLAGIIMTLTLTVWALTPRHHSLTSKHGPADNRQQYQWQNYAPGKRPS
jgi:Mn2+/Fe2+ NRAMP family transporter